MPEYEVIEIPGTDKPRRIGLLGLLTEDPALYRVGAWAGATIEPVVETAVKYKQKLESEENVDLVVPITHRVSQQQHNLALIMIVPDYKQGHCYG